MSDNANEKPIGLSRRSACGQLWCSECNVIKGLEWKSEDVDPVVIIL